MFRIKKDKAREGEAPASVPATAPSYDNEGYVAMDPSEFPPIPKDEVVIDIRDACLWYGEKQALFNVCMPVRRNSITALIGLWILFVKTANTRLVSLRGAPLGRLFADIIACGSPNGCHNLFTALRIMTINLGN